MRVVLQMLFWGWLAYNRTMAINTAILIALCVFLIARRPKNEDNV